MPIVILRGPDYLIELANQAACEVWGRSHEEVIGKPLFDALPETRGHAMQTLLDDVLHNGTTHVGKELLVKLDRFHDKTFRDTYFNFVYTPMRTIDGAAAGVLVTAADVTDEVVARENMNDLREQAEAANHAKDDFLAMLGHELRTPLTAIMGWSRMLRLGLIEPEAQGEAVEAIERAAKTQTQLIEDLLDVSRIVSGKLRLEVQPVDLTDVIPAALSAVKPAANAHSIRLQVVLDPSAGPIAGDPDRLQQIVWNLLSNAVKFTPKNGHIQVRLQRVNSHAELTVSDSGKGIAPDFLPHVFERFLQAESATTRSHGGLGLGLSIVRSLVELHGGTVEARSEGENRGAAFIVRLPMMALQTESPRTLVAAPRRTPRPEVQISFECPAELTGSRVLVVDDDVETRRLLTSIILRCQASVTSAGSVREALQVLDEQEIDVLVSDIEMAGEDGYALIHQLRLRGCHTPAAALTAHARTEDQMRALRAGFDMHVAKPVDPGELVTVIASLLRRSPPARQTS
jgi:PAS domain S-box-containing protein